MNPRKNGNRYTSTICQTDLMMGFIEIWKRDFNARLVAEKCDVPVSSASNFLYSLYRKSKISKTGHKLPFGMINYNLNEV